MADFTVKDKFNKDKNFNRVKFGADAPLLEVELNELQKIQEHARAELIRQSIPSGFLTVLPISVGYNTTYSKDGDVQLPSSGFATALNEFRFYKHVLNLDGILLSTEVMNLVKLGLPPVTGKRTDLVYIESWFEEIDKDETIGKFGGVNNGTVSNDIQDTRIGAETSRRVQLKWAIKVAEGVTDLTDVDALSSTINYAKHATEKDLYVATGSELGEEGISYAIPMFLVERRNSGGYSASNPNGAINYVDANSKSDRADGKFANVIYKDDITDLRHQVSLTGFDYDKLLKQEFNKYMRGELGNKKLLKTYHGVRKTPIDGSTIFYASLDGQVRAEVGGSLDFGQNGNFVSHATGNGYMFKKGSRTPVSITGLNGNEGTIDFFADIDSIITDNYRATVLSLLNTNGFPALSVFFNSNDGINQKPTGFFLQVSNVEGEVFTSRSVYSLSKDLKGLVHFRATWNRTLGLLRIYINGKLAVETSGFTGMLTPTHVVVGAGKFNTSSFSAYDLTGSISDLSVSTIDRGDSFSTLPADFISGDALISPAFDGQRRVFSHAQSSQQVHSIASINDNNHSKGVATNKAKADAWTASDTITLESMSGGVIMGSIDTDTSLATIRSIVSGIGTTTMTIKLDNVEGLAINDTLTLYYNTGNQANIASITVTGIDTSAKNITVSLSSSFGGNGDSLIGGKIFETTISTSSPIIKAIISGVLTSVDGIWSGLGTRKAVFTLGALPNGLTNQDIQFEYSNVVKAGEGALSQVLTNSLQAEFGGKKLVKGTVAVVDDLKGKVSGSVNENPNTVKIAKSSTLLLPTDNAWSELTTQNYKNVDTLGDGMLQNVSTTVEGERAELLISKNIVEIVERKFGKIPATDKIKWLRENLKQLYFKFHGNGSSVGGSKVTLTVFENSVWTTGSTHTGSSINLLNVWTNSENAFNGRIKSDGTIHFLAYAEPSDGSIPSVINVDYVGIDVSLKSPADFEMFVPENPRRDDGLSTVLLVRKETKEVQSIFNAKQTDGIITYGEYLPVQPLLTTEEVTILAESNGFLASDLGTAVGFKQGAHHFPNPLNRVANDRLETYGEFGFAKVPFASDSEGVNIGAKVTVTPNGLNNYIKQYGLPIIKKPLVGVASYLVLHKGELKLLIHSVYNNAGVLEVSGTNAVNILVPISTKPLEKAVEGFILANISPTAWKTPNGEIQGYLNSNGEVIATYQ